MLSGSLTSWLAVASTILFTVYGQIVIKWQMGNVGDLPPGPVDATIFLLKLLANGWVLSGFFAAGIAAFCWMAALTKLDLSFAYPFMALSFVFVLLLSAPLLGESITPAKIASVIVVVVGLTVANAF